MKKTGIILVFFLCALGCKAEVFNCKTVTDHYGDMTLYTECRVVIKETDSTFIIDEKGKDLVIYYKIGEPYYNGNRDDLKDITGRSIYGYETWHLAKDKNGNIKKIDNRYLSKYKYSFEFDEHFFIIRDVTIENGNLSVEESCITFMTKYNPELGNYFRSQKH